MPTSDPKTSQVIRTLTGPVTATSLLGLLQTAYPEDGWDAATLAATLVAGASQGRFTRVQCEPDTVWDLRADMVEANPRNVAYQDDNPRIQQRFETVTASFTHANSPSLPGAASSD